MVLALAARQGAEFALPEESTGWATTVRAYILSKRVALSHQPLVVRRDTLAERASAARGMLSGHGDR